MEKKKNILLDNYLVKNLRAYPVLKKKFMHYIEGTKELPEGFTKRKLFHDYLKVRRNNPEKRVSQFLTQLQNADWRISVKILCQSVMLRMRMEFW